MAVVLALPARFSPAATVLYCEFDSLRDWSVRTAGATGAKITPKEDDTHCLEVRSSRGTVLLSRELPIEAVRGCRVTVSCSVESDGIVRGPQLSSTAKLHLAVQTPQGVRHHSARFVGTADWHQEGFTADVPADAKRVLLNLGLESCFGRARFDRLTVGNDRRGTRPVDLGATANAEHGQLKLAAFPQGTIQWEEEAVPFRIIDAARHVGADCLRLKGVDHPDWPARTAAPIPVNCCASAIYILHGAPAGRESSDSPCVIWTANFAGGQDTGFSVFEGREIGTIGQQDDLENWRVAWRNDDPDGSPVTFGVTKWTIYSSSPILSLSCQAYQGAAPVVLAITVVEEPPAAEPETDAADAPGEDEGGGFQ